MGIYRPPNFNNLDTFFKETNDSLSRASLTYGNFIIMGDFNIDINAAGVEADKLDEFCNLFDLTNLIKTETCCTKNDKSTIELFLTNRPLCGSFRRAAPFVEHLPNKKKSIIKLHKKKIK